MWNNSTITDVGRAMIARCIDGEQLKFARARLGTGTVPAVNLNKQTDVTNFADSATIGEVKRVEDGISCAVRIVPSAQYTYTCKQIGIFGRLLGESQDSLIAIYQDETGIVIPGDMPEFLYKFNAVIAIDNTENVTVTVESGLYTTRDEVDTIVEGERTMLSGTDSKYNPFGANYEMGDLVIYDNEIWRALKASRFVTPEEGEYWTRVSLASLTRAKVYSCTSKIGKVDTSHLKIFKMGNVAVLSGYIQVSDGTLTNAMNFASFPDECLPMTDIGMSWYVTAMTATKKCSHVLVGQSSGQGLTLYINESGNNTVVFCGSWITKN